MSRRVLLLLAAVCAGAFLSMPAASALAGDANAGDVWVDNVGQPAGPGHEMDPHLACQDINLWGAGLADASGTYTIDGWPPSGGQEQLYAGSWSYDQWDGAAQVIDVIAVRTLIENAIAAGDAPVNGQGFHFKLQFSQDPQKHKTFWVNCGLPTLTTAAGSATAGQPIHDVAHLSGGDSPTGTIVWTLYGAGDSSCQTPLGSVSEPVNGDGTYTSPGLSPAAGSYQWVATYGGDANNLPASTACNDPQEQSTVQPAPAPAITLVKLERDGNSGAFTHGPLTGDLGETIQYQMTVADTGNTPLQIDFSDPGCDPGTLAGPTVLSGTFNAATDTLSAGGELRYTCSHLLGAADASGYTNTASATGQPPSGPPVVASDSVQAFANTPAIRVVKLQRDGSSGPFTTGTINAVVGTTIDYEIQVSNTGALPLTLSISDPMCDVGTISGPVAVAGTLIGDTLAPGGEAQYTCSHVLRGDDASPFINTATVTGQPPAGPPVVGTSSVSANKQALSARKVLRCRRGTVRRTERRHGRRVVVCVPRRHPPRRRSRRPVVIRRHPRPPQFTG